MLAMMAMMGAVLGLRWGSFGGHRLPFRVNTNEFSAELGPIRVICHEDLKRESFVARGFQT